MLPLLAAIAARGGQAAPRDLYGELADEFGLADDVRAEMAVDARGRRFKTFERRVRWTRQTAVEKGLVSKEARGRWELTDQANHVLQNARRGTIVTVFETEHGVALWANVEDAIGIIEPSSIDLIFTSPPYPLLEKKKAYGNLPAREWVDWMVQLCDGWRELLTPTGSIMLNVGPTWNRGVPTQSTYIERLVVALEDELGLHLCQRLYWQNPTKLPQPREWVAIQRVRVKPQVEPILWLSPNPRAAANNRNVLVPYSPRTRRDAGASAIERRPSGIDVNRRSFAKDNGGAIPGDVLRVSNAVSNSTYHRALRATNGIIHPAMFPHEIVEFAVKLTTEPKQRVADMFFGSGVVGEVCERLDREWVGVERSLTYLEGAMVRFPGARSIMKLLEPAA
jgi:site-specific DNA-methyltransferase (cytosine-N4-specific)